MNPVFLSLLFFAFSGSAPDAVKADPKHYKVEFENDQVRVLRIVYGPGEKSAMHSHPAGIAVTLTDSHFRFTLPDGQTQELKNAAGQALPIPTGDHLPQNLGDKPAVVILVELKSPARSDIPPELKDAMRARDGAVDGADAATWDRYTADDFTVVRADGRVMTKAQRLAELRQEKPRAATPPSDEHLSRYGNTVIRRFRSGDLRVLDVWVYDPAHGWRVSAVQLTPVPAAK